MHDPKQVRFLACCLLLGVALIGCDPAEDATQGQAAARSHQENRDQGTESAARGAAQSFMDRRVMGRQAEIMVAPEARQFFRVGGQLGPLYPRPRLKDFRIVFVDGPLGDSAWEIGVKLIFKRGSYGQTYFMAYDGHNYRVVSGRTGLIGP